MQFQTYAAGILLLAAPIVLLIALVTGRSPLSIEQSQRASRPVRFWIQTLLFVVVLLVLGWVLWIDHPQAQDLVSLAIIVQLLLNWPDLVITLRHPRPLSKLEFADDNRIGRTFLRIALGAYAALLSIGALLLLGDILFDIL